MSSGKNNRCGWAGEESMMADYHDEEWGVPVYDDKELFEFLILEGAQAGLSWSTILKRRQGYRDAFVNFEVERVANFSESDFERLVQDKRIIRNKLKIKSAINNAQHFLEIQKEFGSFSNYIWQFVDNNAIQNEFSTLSEIPASTPLSNEMSKDLKKRGFSFVGPTICYAYMQSIGMVNDHITSCYRYNQIKALSTKK
ncbi:MAG: DNA-3-methyladenine glycosylase I [Candidatus Hodarchaeales archaeon]|jgi:DNA-3-methyladenine glycosylase I